MITYIFCSIFELVLKEMVLVLVLDLPSPIK